DRNGRPVSDLRQQDFVLRDNGKTRPIQYLWRETDLPLTVGLIVDVSGSQIRFVEEHKRTMQQFLEQVLRPQDQAVLVAVGGDVRLVTDLTRSIDELRTGVDTLGKSSPNSRQMVEPCPNRIFSRPGRPPFEIPGCGGTILWEGVYAAARQKMKAVDGRKAMIVLSDGFDTGSPHTLNDAVEASQSAETLVYTIRYSAVPLPLASGPSFQGRRCMGHLANETGGRVYSSPAAGPAKIFGEIESELRSLYVLGFTIPEGARDGKFHKLEVKSKRGGVTVRARTGYT